MATLAGKVVGQNGLGLMRMTTPGESFSDEQAFKVLNTALEVGVNVWNGADFYGTLEYNSLHLLARYFAKYPEDADSTVICIKSGLVDMSKFAIDGSPEAVNRFVDRANKILGNYKKIDIFGIARVDPKVPIEDTVEALAKLVAAGKIGGIQLSEVGATTIRRAVAKAKIDMVEVEASLWTTNIFDNGVATTCGDLRIPIVAHTPLGAGMLTGKIRSFDDLPASHYFRALPRFQLENFQKNQRLVAELEKLAQRTNSTLTQLALSWLKLQSRKFNAPFIIPIAGTRFEERLRENVVMVNLTEEDFKAIQLVLDTHSVSGKRYPEAGMRLVEF